MVKIQIKTFSQNPVTKGVYGEITDEQISE